MSVAIDQPVLHTPADEWAKETQDALHPAPSSLNNTKVVPPVMLSSSSVQSTPGAELPGAFPREAIEEMAKESPYKIQETVNQGIESARQYFPTQQTVQSYVPAQEDVRRAVGSAAETAKTYLPEPVIQAVGKLLPAGATTANTTTPPQNGTDIMQDFAPIDSAKSASEPQDSSASFASNPSITEDGVSENLGSGAAPMSNATDSMKGNGTVVGNAVGGIATKFESTSDSKSSPLSKPLEPKVSTSNIQVPYGESNSLAGETTLTEHPIDQDEGIARTNAALEGLKSGPSDPQPIRSNGGAPTPPPKPDNEVDLVGKRTAHDVSHVNTMPTHSHFTNDSGLQGPDTKFNTGVGGAAANLSADSVEGSGSEGSGSGHTEGAGGSPKKKKGSKFIAKVKEKLHVGH